MWVSVAIATLTCVALIVVVLAKIQIKISGHSFSVYPVVPFIGGVILLITGILSIQSVSEKLFSSAPSNPLKIIVLFMSMSLISVFLDETGFFEYVAELIAQKSGENQIKIFVTFYITVSILTVFTSNDVVILTFTPFICQFCKRSGIDPVPYIVTEFVAANTWSLLFLIGNPTNIFLTQSYGIDFATYFSRMWLPTIFCGLSSFTTLYFIFRKKLKKPVNKSIINIKLKDKTSAVIAGILLLCCTVLIAISSYIGLEMWYVSLIAAATLFIAVGILKLATKKDASIIIHSLKRAPWQMIPLVIGMFIVVLSLVDSGATKILAECIGTSHPITKYGIISTLSSNVTNNIPMSVLFASVCSEIPDALIAKKAVYSTVIGSNIGAFLTPLGALAGLMFTSIVKRHGVKFGFRDFTMYGVPVAVVSLVFALLGLYLSFLLF